MINKTFLSIGFILAAVFVISGSYSVNASQTDWTSLEPGLETGISGTIRSAPTSTPAAGSYTSNQSVTLSATGSSAICYTTTGTTPACATALTCTTGDVYDPASPVSIASTKTVKSVACYGDNSTSSVASYTYTLSCATASVANGSVSAYPTCSISCNSGYTLSGSSCVASGVVGGGGGGGYFPLITPTPVVAPTVTVTVLQQQLNTLITQLQNLLKQAQAQGIPLPSGIEQYIPTLPVVPVVSFTRDLTINSRGEDVRQLQQFLNNKGFKVAESGPGSPGNETTMFGALTRAALARFQASVGISPAVGYFGPITRAYLKSIGY